MHGSFTSAILPLRPMRLNEASHLENTPSWHLLGAGALGCLFAAHWQRAGIALDMIVRDDSTLQQLNNNGGITLACDNQRSTIAITATTATIAQVPISQLIVCTKALQTQVAIAAIKTQLTADAVIVLLQNGMGVRELLQSELPHATILHGLSTEGAFRTAPFHVTHAGRGQTFIGSVDLQQQTLAKKIVQSLQCDLSIAFAPDIAHRLWLKLAVNSVINPLTALYRCRNGELLQRNDIALTVTQLCEELALIAQAEHIDLDTTAMRDEIYRVMQATAANKSSMLQDIEAGRATEIDFINGFIVERAHAHNLPCPRHQQLLQAIHVLQP